MGKETIMLAKTYDAKKVQYPCVVSEKLDGVAADFYVPTGSNSGHCLVRSRQDETYYSVEHITDWLTGRLPEGCHIIAELYIPGVPFKDISGKVRDTKEGHPDLVAYVYDWYREGHEKEDYQTRMADFAATMGQHISPKNDWMVPVRIIPGNYCVSEGAVQVAERKILKRNPTSEGIVIRAMTGEASTYEAGKRPWGFIKKKIVNTEDLEVVSFEEAIDKHGDPKGMVGRINVLYKGKVVGVGPGCLSHPERKAIWINPHTRIGSIAEVSFMPDESYDAMREPRFIRWRDDKSA